MLAGMKTKVLLYQTTNFFGSTVEGLLGKESDDQIASKITFFMFAYKFKHLAFGWAQRLLENFQLVSSQNSTLL